MFVILTILSIKNFLDTVKGNKNYKECNVLIDSYTFS